MDPNNFAIPRCSTCDRPIFGDAEIVVCLKCAERFPRSLCKAAVDPFDYAIGLRSGCIIRFEHALFWPGGEWVTLEGVKGSGRMGELPFVFERGIDVRVDEILWCADAPDGS